MAEQNAVDPEATTGPHGTDPDLVLPTNPDEADEPARPDVTEPEDDSPPTGPRRVLIALYAVFALAATARGVVQIVTKFDDAPLAYLLSLFSGLVYIAATVGLVTNRPWSRPLAWAAVGTEMVGVITVGLASIFDSTAFPHDTVWSRFGAGYGYVPIILPVLGLMWLWQTRGHAGRQSER
ncbi:MAG: hypothetical protein ABWZ98_07095 [Nakamurella sp.]